MLQSTFCSFGAGELKHVSVLLKAHDLISSRTLSSSHAEILQVISGSARLEENHRIKTDLEGCQHDGG